MIRYTDSLDGITPAQLAGFFVGWPNPPSAATHLRLLAGSTHRLLALDDATGHAVGFVTALSDGVSCASIPLLEVLPAYQGRGIGSALMRQMLARLADLYAIDLLCDPAVQPFYQRLGLQPATGMMRRIYAHQAGQPPTDTRR